MIIEAVFMGRDRSLGYRHLKKYRLNVYMNSVRDVEGVGLSCPYSNVEAFLRNWQMVRVIQVVGEEVEKKRLPLRGLFPNRVT